MTEAKGGDTSAVWTAYEVILTQELSGVYGLHAVHSTIVGPMQLAQAVVPML
jgi:hypothetical protein